MKISLIAAIGKNRELGKDNKLLWNLPEDLKRFRDITRGHPIIMGRKTFESIGRVLPGRLNIVITRNQESRIKNQEKDLMYVGSLEEGIEAAKSWLNTKYSIPNTDEHEVFIIGGGQIFEQAIGMADKLYLTVVDGDFEADTYFPQYDVFNHIAHEQESSYNGLRYTFLDLTKDQTDS